MTDPADAYGVAYFRLDPGKPGGDTTITVTYCHAPTATAGAARQAICRLTRRTGPFQGKDFKSLYWNGP
jgi:hypothetical protein